VTTMERSTQTLRAVHDDDLEAFLEALGIASDVRAGRMDCAFCKDTVTLANLHAVFPDGGDVKVVCDRPDCVKELLARLEARRYGD
jgi:hypothetical protein